MRSTYVVLYENQEKLDVVETLGSDVLFCSYTGDDFAFACAVAWATAMLSNSDEDARHDVVMAWLDTDVGSRNGSSGSAHRYLNVAYCSSARQLKLAEHRHNSDMQNFSMTSEKFSIDEIYAAGKKYLLP